MNSFNCLLTRGFFSGCAKSVVDGSLKKDSAYAVVRRFIKDTYPSAECVFAFGSVVKDALGPLSDIDLLIIAAGDMQSGAKRYTYDGCLIEAHVFTRKQFLDMLRLAAVSGRFNISFSLIDCDILLDGSGLGKELRDLVVGVSKGRPSEMRSSIASQAYCAIASSIIEVATNPSEDERFSTVVAIQPMIMNLYFAVRREWAASKKWAVRQAPVFAHRLNAALQESYKSGEVSEIIEILHTLVKDWPDLKWDGTHATLELL